MVSALEPHLSVLSFASLVSCFLSVASLFVLIFSSCTLLIPKIFSLAFASDLFLFFTYLM